ncbi:hypothetical protein E2C01_021673 [Portunus trituberculatus]|uniref:Uncharacterized protein n=1 Tax=Portunus trituberculatus TaxID=210409 RepID=A0A5B7E3Z5_PORTR|nr:hypothetical protein [Portunus trituberculatus]
MECLRRSMNSRLVSRCPLTKTTGRLTPCRQLPSTKKRDGRAAPTGTDCGLGEALSREANMPLNWARESWERAEEGGVKVCPHPLV